MTNNRPRQPHLSRVVGSIQFPKPLSAPSRWERVASAAHPQPAQTHALLRLIPRASSHMAQRSALQRSALQRSLSWGRGGTAHDPLPFLTPSSAAANVPDLNLPAHHLYASPFTNRSRAPPSKYFAQLGHCASHRSSPSCSLRF